MATNKCTISTLLICLLLLCSISSTSGQQLVLDHEKLSTCATLDSRLPGRVAFEDSDAYKAQTNSYWAINQGQINSSCRVTPRNITDLQQILAIIYQTDTPFAVKSGGHSVVAGTSNVEKGIVIDLELLNHIVINKEAEYIDIGVGARWKDVYDVLDGREFGVTGARAGSVGVGGYLLGGGLSIYEGQQGWACDSVLQFEVVLANGTSMEVSEEQHVDLFKALKGSATNFGIVTRARLRLIPDGPDVDVINLSYRVEQLRDVADAVVRYNIAAGKDPLANVAISVGGRATGSDMGVSVFMTHPHKVRTSPVLKHFFDIPHGVGTQMRMSQSEIAMLYDEMNPGGYRQYRTTTTVRNEAGLFESLEHDLKDLFAHLLYLNDTNTQCGFLIQPLTLPHLHTSKTTGGNILGLEDEVAPLLLLSFELRYSDVKDRNTITSLGSKFMNSIEHQAASENKLHKYRYLNYASAGQDVFGYIKPNEELWRWLLEVKHLYDPYDVFGRQMRHLFKVG